jgi:hypothetical protein
VLEPTAYNRVVELTRTWLAQGRAHEEVLDLLRERGLSKADSYWVLQAATGMSPEEAKLLVHHSATWADHREADEQLEESLWRALFISCVLGVGQVVESAAWAAECRQRQQQATGQLLQPAADLPDEAVIGFREALEASRFGQAFIALVEVGQQRALPNRYWLALSAVADSLCLNELLDSDSTADDLPEVSAARTVRHLTHRIPDI